MKRFSLIRRWRKIFAKAKKDNISAIAGQSALFLFLSGIPFLLFFFSLIPYLPISVNMVYDTLTALLPDYMEPAVASVISEFYAKSVHITVVALIAAIYLAAQGFHCISNGLNVVYHVQENRGWVRLRLQAMRHTVLFLITVLLVFLILIYGNSIQSYLIQRGEYFPVLFRFFYQIRYVLLFGFLVFYFALVYFILPNRGKAEPGTVTYRNQLPGALFSTAAWFLFSAAISIYVDDFNGFSLYGSLTRLAVIIIWLYLCMFTMMLGAEINYHYHKQINAFFQRHPLFHRSRQKNQPNPPFPNRR